MGAVSVLATIFALLGWLSLVGSLFLIVAGGVLSSQLLKSPQAGQLAAGLLAPYILICLTPFLAWGVLTGLVEIHRQNERLTEVLDDIRRGQRTGTSP